LTLNFINSDLIKRQRKRIHELKEYFEKSVRLF
jgi:hypothetical protein